MRKVLLALSLIGLSAPANAIVTVYFQGADAKNWVNGSFSYDPSIEPWDVLDFWDNFSITRYSPAAKLTMNSNFAFPLGGYANYDGYYYLEVVDAFAGESKGATDSFSANIEGHIQSSFSIDFLRDDALNGSGLPVALPSGKSSFSYSYKGDGWSMPVTYSYTPFISAVPEPETWAIMLFGFGTVASGLRSRKLRRPALA